MNTPFYQSAATTFLALIGLGIFVESRAGGRRAAASASSGSGAPGACAAGHGRRRLPSRRRLAEVTRAGGYAMTLGLMLALGELLCLVALANKVEHGWQQGVVSLTLIYGVILTFASIIGAVLEERLPNLRRRRLEIALTILLSVVATTLLLIDNLNKGSGFGSFRLPQATLPAGSYFVHGTCADGRCGLTERQAPRRSGKPTGRILADNDVIHIVCQTQGESFTDAHGSTSAVWDRLADGGYVTDVFVKTPGKGTFSPELKRCPNPVGAASG